MEPPSPRGRRDAFGAVAPLYVLRHVAFAWIALLTTSLGWWAATLTLAMEPRRGTLAGRVGSLWSLSLLAAARVRVRIEGRERLPRGEARVIMANHASFLDPPLLAAILPPTVRYVLKRELARMPFVGWHARLGGHFLIDRSDPRAGRRLLQRAAERARRLALLPVIFPEGTRSPDGRLQALKPGAFQLAIEGGLPVQPVAVLGTAPIMPKHAWGPHRPGDVLVRVGEPIDTTPYRGSQGRKALAERVEAALLALGVPGRDGAAS